MCSEKGDLKIKKVLNSINRHIYLGLYVSIYVHMFIFMYIFSVLFVSFPLDINSEYFLTFISFINLCIHIHIHVYIVYCCVFSYGH